jgi:sugar lactone lactonase YvrE
MMAIDKNGDVPVSEAGSRAIRRVTATGAVTTKKGISLPRRFDAAGNLYISDFGHAAVYKLTKTGAMSVFAGSPGREGDVDGSVGFATLGYYTIDSMTIDDGGNLYLSGQGRLRKVSPAGVVSTPTVPWGVPTLATLAWYKGSLYAATRSAILKMAVE